MIIRPVINDDVINDDVKAFQAIMKTSITVLCTSVYGAEVTAAWVSGDNPVLHFKLPKFAYVAEEAGEIVVVGGWSDADTVALHPASDRVMANPTHARINAVYVKPGFEGHGLGRKMTAYLEADIRDRTALRNIYLWATKNAIPFYLAMGYTAGVDEYPEVAPGFKIQIRYMWKRLARAH